MVEQVELEALEPLVPMASLELLPGNPGPMDRLAEPGEWAEVVATAEQFQAMAAPEELVARLEGRAMAAMEQRETRPRRMEGTEETEAMWEWPAWAEREAMERSPGRMEPMAQPQPPAATAAMAGPDFPQ
jgi:hypothetical protein